VPSLLLSLSAEEDSDDGAKGGGTKGEGAEGGSSDSVGESGAMGRHTDELICATSPAKEKSALPPQPPPNEHGAYSVTSKEALWTNASRTDLANCSSVMLEGSAGSSEGLPCVVALKTISSLGKHGDTCSAPPEPQLPSLHATLTSVPLSSE